MIYYSKITTNNPAQKAHDLFISLGAHPDMIVLDDSPIQKQPDSIFQNLKEYLLEHHESLVIDALSSLGKNFREISKEIQWFLHNDIKLHVVELPSTFESSVKPTQLLSEVYSVFAATEIRNVKENQKIGIQRGRAQNKPLGRKKIPYPDNWETTYQLWEQKQISAAQFMQLTNLKKGTLYNLIKQYKEQQSINENMIEKDA